ncbi:MAG: cytochrome c biogenesis protein CcmG/thiol:disulfide interchange protein DsbE [Cellvibrionaceae bacterium]|jgi:cytochrome c biogenesis protein CcmG/thiol:disulfide interchange protein DsbE
MAQVEIKTPRISRFGIAVIVIVVAMLALMAWGLANNSTIRPQIGEAVPDLELVFFEGYRPAEAPITDHGDTHLSDYQGQIVVLNFWASWCIECRLETPELEAFSQQWGDEVEVIGIAYTDIEARSIEFLQRYGATYGNAPDLGGRLSNSFRITGVPETFVIAPDGTLAAFFIGPVSGEQLSAVVESLSK